jgi:hypothetical protein
MSASQVWLGNYAPSHFISSYIYVAVGHILAGTIKHISTNIPEGHGLPEKGVAIKGPPRMKKDDDKDKNMIKGLITGAFPIKS